MKSLPEKQTLQYVSIEILGPLPEKARRNVRLAVITDRIRKMTFVSPIRTTTALKVAWEFSKKGSYRTGNTNTHFQIEEVS